MFVFFGEKNAVFKWRIGAPSDVGNGAGDRAAEGVPSDLQHAARDEEEEEEGAAQAYDHTHPYALPADRWEATPLFWKDTLPFGFFCAFHSKLPHQFHESPAAVLFLTILTKTDVAPLQLPRHVPVDAEGVQPVEQQREADHRHDDRDGRDEVTQWGRGGRLDPDEVSTVVDMSIQDAPSSKVTLMRARVH